MKPKLWTRDFTIITTGTFVSMLGNAMAGIALSLLVLDYTGSTLMFSIFLVLNNLPKIVMPLVAGPFLDRFSRKKMVVMLDYLSGGMYYLLFMLLTFNSVGLGVLLFATTMFGTLDSVYNVAYDSLYPNLVAKENYSKAYSVASMLYPLAAIAAPLGTFLYNAVGIAPILLVNAASFFAAAFAESFITHNEAHALTAKIPYNRKRYARDFREGVNYIKSHKGLLLITIYMCLNMVCDSTQTTLVLPYFKSTAGLSEFLFSMITLCGVFGRLIGGGLHYKYKYPAKWKFAIACMVYIATCVMDGAMLFVPLAVMFTFQFVSGLMAVTSYNIRISAIQSSLPDGYRARLNGVFSMVFAAGAIIGQLLSGALAELIPLRAVVIIFSAANILFVFAIVMRGAKYIKPIYNREI